MRNHFSAEMIFSFLDNFIARSGSSSVSKKNGVKQENTRLGITGATDCFFGLIKKCGVPASNRMDCHAD